MARDNYYGNFKNLSFPKSGKHIVQKATALRDTLVAKIKEREERIRGAAAEAGLKDAADVFLSLQAVAEGTSSHNGINMNVGLAAKVRSEVSALSEERKEVDRLRLIIENLPPDSTFDLDFDELRYFGW